MLRGILHVGAWAAATGAAVALSWLGVHGVLAPRAPDLTAPPVPAADRTGTVGAGPYPGAGALPPEVGNATRRPPPPSASPSPGTAGPTQRAESGTGSSGTGDVHSYTLAGGQVVLDVSADEVGLVSAVPEPGWGMRVRSGRTWLRVDFSRGDTTGTLLATWKGRRSSVRVLVS